jgi:pyroglutamyl-peptidase
MVILVTGFEPFGGLDVNPSQQIVEALARTSSRPSGIVLETEILPCVFRAAGERIAELIRQHRPDAVVSLGLAASTAPIRLERVAVNVNDATRPDNSGDLASGRTIVQDGPVGYWSTLPLERMRDEVQGREIPAMISNHAGAYVCNHVFYSARHEIERLGWATPCGFIHVPLLAGQIDPSSGVQGSMTIDTMVEAVEACLGVLAEQIGVDDAGLTVGSVRNR